MIGLRNFERSGMVMMYVGWKKKSVIQVIPSNDLLFTCSSKEEMDHLQRILWKHGIDSTQNFLYQSHMIVQNRRLISPMRCPLNIDRTGFLSISWKNQDQALDILKKEDVYLMSSLGPNRYILR